MESKDRYIFPIPQRQFVKCFDKDTHLPIPKEEFTSFSIHYFEPLKVSNND
jgi:hypothetical protein